RFLSGYDKVLATAAPKNPQLILQGNELVGGCIGFGPGACSGAGADADADADVYIDADADADDSSVCMGLGSAQTSASSASSVTEFDGEFAAASCKHSRAAYKDSSSSSQTAAETTASYNDVFRRKWEYYFAYCEGAFATRTLGCSQLVFTRTYNEDLSNIKLLA
ncbi:hypothetical protein LPJ57_007986, partial [Coemansia sp. RSA 486]